MAAMAKRGEHGWWEPVLELVVHVVVGSLLFAVIFAPAVGLDLTIGWLKERTKVSEFLVWLLTATKVLIGVIDACLYDFFMIWMGWVFIRKLIWGYEEHEHNKQSG